MKTKKDGFVKAFDSYTQAEADLIISHLPTTGNVAMLALALGRTQKAIRMVFNRCYESNWLKISLNKSPNGNSIVHKTLTAKRKLGIFIGHQRKVS